MSLMYCTYCDRYIDTDEDVEHFDEEGECVLMLEEQEAQQAMTYLEDA